MQLKGYLGTIEFDGNTVIITKKLRGEMRIPIRQVAETEIGNAGIGMAYIRITTVGTGFSSQAGHVFKTHASVAKDPQVLTFRRSRKDEFRSLQAAIETRLAEMLI